jgi:uncharacterized protein YjbJ (UPF0337 family)
MGGQKDQVAGKSKEFIGKVTGDKEAENEGKRQNAKGKVEKRAEDVVASAKGATKAVKDKLNRR